MKIFHKDSGNLYDKMSIDLDMAFEQLPSGDKVHKISRSYFINKMKELKDTILKWMETRVMIGKGKYWFDEFCDFWKFLDSRSLSIVDFHALRTIYRLRSQAVQRKSWDNIFEHMSNWKNDGAWGAFGVRFITML